MLLLLLCDECLLLMPVASTVELLLFILCTVQQSRNKKKDRNKVAKIARTTGSHIMGGAHPGFQFYPKLPAVRFCAR